MGINTVVVAEMFYLINIRHILAPAFSREGLTGNRYELLAIAACIPLHIAYTHAPFMQVVFDSAALSGPEWIKLISAGLFVFCMVELEKLLIRRSHLASKIFAL